uniref:Methyl methanesulfonate-sensitivity protein 22-like n=1 Tax=Romanomermis culicivorax TaxID=13658 RepID=A0A915HM53_ROMCU
MKSDKMTNACCSADEFQRFEMSRFLSNELHKNTDLSLFGRTYDAEYFMDEDVQEIFDKIRCYLNKMESLLSKRSNSYYSSTVIERFSDVDFQQWKVQFRGFFNYLIEFLQSDRMKNFNNAQVERFLKKLSNELRGLILDIGYLYKLTLNEKGNQNIYTHICWDIRYYTLIISKIIVLNHANLSELFDFVQISGQNESSPSNFLLSLINLQIFDIFSSIYTFHKKNPLFCDDVSLPCICIKFYWIALKDFVNSLSNSFRFVPPFSDLLKIFLEKNILDDNVTFVEEHNSNMLLLSYQLKSVDPDLDIRDVLWKILSNLSTIEQSQQNTGLDYCILFDCLLKITVINPMLDDRSCPKITPEFQSRIRRYLIFYLKFLSKLENNRSSVVLPDLVDSFCKRINDNFYFGATLDDFKCHRLNDSILDYFRDIASYCTILDDRQLGKLTSSFSLFLNILGIHCSGVAEISSRIVDFVGGFDMKITSLPKIKLVARTFEILTMVLIDTNADSSQFLGNLKELLNKLLDRYIAVRYEPEFKQGLNSARLRFIGLHILKIAGPGPDVNIERILKDCREDLKAADLKIILQFYYQILRQNLQIFKLGANSNFGIIVEYVKNEVSTKIWPLCKKTINLLLSMDQPTWPTLPDLLFHLTVNLHFKYANSPTQKQLFDEIYEFVCWNPNFNGLETCRYVGFLISSQYLSDNLLQDHTIVQSWIRCLLTTIDSSQVETLVSVTDFVFKENYLVFPVELSDVPKNYAKFSSNTLHYLCDKIEKCQSSSIKSQILLYLDKPIRFGVDLLKNSTEKIDIIKHLILCFGFFVEKCVSILHKRDDPRSLLKIIVDQTILFSAKTGDFQEKFWAINDAMPLMISGMLKIPGWLYDSFLKNAFCDAYRLSLQRLCMQNGDRATKHNFNFIFTTISDTFADEFDSFGDQALLRKYCLRKAICNCFDRLIDSFRNKDFSSKVAATTTVASVKILLDLIVKLVEKTSHRSLITEDCRDFLPKCLSCWIRCNEDSLSTIFFDTTISLIQVYLVNQENNGIFNDLIKEIIAQNLRLYGDKTVKVFRQLNHDAHFRTNVNVNEIFSSAVANSGEVIKFRSVRFE